jgi:hypothetical protein
VDVGLDASRYAAEIELCVAVVAGARFGREPTIEVVTIGKKKSARLVGTFEYAVACRVLREQSRALELISDRFSCATAVMDTSARTPTTSAARFIEYFSCMLGLLLIFATADSLVWQRYQRWLRGSWQP